MGESRNYNLVRQTLGRALHLCFRPRYRGQESVPVDGPLIIAANHLSHIDPAFIMTATPRPVTYLSKQEHFDGRLRRALFSRMGVIPVLVLNPAQQPRHAALRLALEHRHQRCGVQVTPRTALG